MSKEPLKFIVAPHIVQDLGLNLYTSLPRVLVEFIANSYDADSPYVNISLDKKKIERERRVIRKQWELDKAKTTDANSRVVRLEERTLPEDIEIIIEDAGHGMSRKDIQEKFLVAGRRRREKENTKRSAKGRVLMGRKGLGKLAGFGVAQIVRVISRAKGELHATEIILDYNKLIKVKDTNEIPIEEKRLEDGGGFEEHGTRVILGRLLYEPMKSRLETIEHQAADHFAQIDPKDFQIQLNDKLVKPTPRRHVYGWPEPNRPINEMVKASYETEDGRTISFQYRLRFTEDRAALIAKDRGVRVYSNKRLTAAPSLLDADTNMHGFRMTDYLDGVAYADFIDEQPEDYIATDRQALRWESPLLSPMYDLLSREIKEACLNRQKARDKEKEREVKQDEFTKQLIQKAAFNKREKKVAYRLAAAISSLHKEGFKSLAYQTKFSQVIRGLGQGEILTSLANLAEQKKPDLDRVVAEITRLNAEELDGFYQFVKGRINGIKALKKIVEAVDFKEKKNEKTIQKMFEESPWMIDPTYTQFLSADRGLGTLFSRLAKELRIGEFAPTGSEDTDKRPDLVFMIGNETLNRLVIVELKAPNVQLEQKHLDQLEYYMERAEQWLNEQSRADVNVHGHLVGSKASPQSRAEGVVTLRRHIKKAGPDTPWKVRDFMDVLRDTEAAHHELLDIHRKAEASAASADDIEVDG